MATAATQIRTAPPPATSSRMTLASVLSGRKDSPMRILAFGPEGVGKSSFAADAPAPVFICPEDGVSHLDVRRFPEPATWQDVRDALRVLADGEHGYQTVVVDTLDWLEPLCHRFICERDRKANVEDYGYGKGYVAALDEWRIFIADLERLRKARGMNVVLLAHAQQKSYKNPEGEDYDRFTLKIHDKAAGLLKEWCDAVLFCRYDELAHKDEKTKRVRGVSTGTRLIKTVRTAAYDAKNRYNLPETLPLSWAEFEAAAKAGGQSVADLALAIEERLGDLGDAGIEKTTRELMKTHGGDASMLAKILDRLNLRITEKREKESK